MGCSMTNNSITRRELTEYLNQLLAIDAYKDCCPNGLQVEGCFDIRCLVTGVTACEDLLMEAIRLKADAVLVHHGYFWKYDTVVVTGILRRRLNCLLKHNISLLTYHLPLDIHPVYGNNVQLAERLSISHRAFIPSPSIPNGLLCSGILEPALSGVELFHLLDKTLNRMPLHIKGKNEYIRKIAWCTGAAQDFISHVLEAGCDAYVTGEVSERTVHIAREGGIHFFSAGHHATERFGVQALGEHLADKFSIQHHFVDIDNPV